MYREKLQSLLNAILLKDNDTMAQKVVGDLIASTGKYVRAVVELEGAVMSAKHQFEGEVYREYIGNLDSIRSIAHNSLISNMKIVNRLCDKYEVEPIYTGSDERAMIGDFAGELAIEFFQTRKK